MIILAAAPLPGQAAARPSCGTRVRGPEALGDDVATAVGCGDGGRAEGVLAFDAAEQVRLNQVHQGHGVVLAG